MDIEKELNEKQCEAVTSASQHLRIVAGAGSGKTRVLTYRVAFLISEMHVKPWNILAITFTNKVAAEMKERVMKLIPGISSSVMIKTFHSFAAFFLRQEIGVLGYPATFTIIDDDDQTKLVKDIAHELGFKRTDPIVKKALGYISKKKCEGLMPEDITIKNEFFEGEKSCLKIYELYEEAKNNMFILDFDDLLVKTNYILENYPEIRTKWRDKYDHILIDEFQDTNNVEYKLIRLIKRSDASLYVVGDPDQTIYTWRGANQSIILDLNKNFENVETIILNQNYRSTKTILDSANKLIDNNKLRVKKDLFTDNDAGEKIITKSCSSSRVEADYVSRQIEQLVKINGYDYRDIAILYRSNYITQEFEQSFTAKHIPYRVFGGVKFYQRREIKDVIAYFNLVVNTKDDISFERIMNVPKRGIGESSLIAIKSEAKNSGQSMYEYILSADPSFSEAPKKAIVSLKSMIAVIDKAREDIAKDEEVFSKILEDMLSSFNYYDYLLKEDDGDERVENVRALFSDIRHYLQTNPEADFSSYLQNIALLSGQDEIVDGSYVSLMTVHTAKGLEYPVVFIVRTNESVFPNARCLMESGHKGLEEERRLFYVAMTRAKEKLYLTYATDYSYVAGGNLVPSKFIKESGNEIKEERSIWGGGSKYSWRDKYFDDEQEYMSNAKPKEEPKTSSVVTKTNGITDWKVGDSLMHKTLGKGKVISLEGNNILRVMFEEHGEKSIMGNHPFVSKAED